MVVPNDFIKKVKEMAKRGQIEIIGGGYYEPIFAIIPYRDKIAQIKKLSELIKNEFCHFKTANVTGTCKMK